MTKVLITCSYIASVEIGDLSPALIKEALEKSENFSLFDFDLDLDDVAVEAIK